MSEGSSGFRKLNRKDASLTGLAYHQLRTAILEGRLNPGQTLVEEQLAADFDISRTPLREALAMLKNEGLVEAVPYRGTFVSIPTRAEFIEIIQVRQRLESLAIELAINLIPEIEIKRVRAFILKSRPRLLRGDWKADMECQQKFHGLAPAYSANRVLEKLIDNLDQESSRFLRGGEHFGSEELNQSADEHLAILEMYRRRDSAQAIELMVDHLQASLERIKSITRV
jgi:DNA-binding GntR family transcriptional regulator